MNNYQSRQQAKNNISEGFKQMNEAKQAEGKKENVVASVDFNEHREATPAEKDQHINDMTNAINILTERLNKLEGGGE